MPGARYNTQVFLNTPFGCQLSSCFTMIPLARLFAPVLASTLLACAPGVYTPIRNPITPLPANSALPKSGGSFDAYLMGLDSLNAATLPAGVREIRVDLGCGNCTPDYLLRIITGPGRRVVGEAFILQSFFERDPDDTAGMRIDREYKIEARLERDSLKCSRPIPTWEHVADFCHIGLPINWRAIVTLLDSSGMLTTPRDNRPPQYDWTVRTDSATGRMTISGAENFWCNDIGGATMSIEILDGDKYRSAGYGCLEHAGPPGTVHSRIAAVREALERSLRP